MTKEELEKEIKNYIDKNCKQWETDGLTVDDIVRIAVLDFAEPREKQIAELEARIEKMKWHDLRKDPNDLPKCNNADLLLYIEGKKFKNNFYSLFSRIEQPPSEEQMKRFMITCNVIAWGEILRFKE